MPLLATVRRVVCSAATTATTTTNSTASASPRLSSASQQLFARAPTSILRRQQPRVACSISSHSRFFHATTSLHKKQFLKISNSRKGPKVPDLGDLAIDGSGKRYQEWPLPMLPVKKKFKGRVPVRIGGGQRGNHHRFGPFAIAVRAGVVVHQDALASAKERAKKVLKSQKGAKVFMRVFATIPRTKKSIGIRMGKGKGSISHFVARVPKDHIVLEVGGNVEPALAKEAVRQAGFAIPGRVKILVKAEDPEELFLPKAIKKLQLHPPVRPFVEIV